MRDIVRRSDRRERKRLTRLLPSFLSRVRALTPRIDRLVTTLSLTDDVGRIPWDVNEALQQLEEDAHSLDHFNASLSYLISIVFDAIACCVYKQPTVVAWGHLLLCADVNPNKPSYCVGKVYPLIATTPDTDHYPHLGCHHTARKNYITLPDGRNVKMTPTPYEYDGIDKLLGDNPEKLCDLLEWLLGDDHKVFGHDSGILIIQPDFYPLPDSVA